MIFNQEFIIDLILINKYLFFGTTELECFFLFVREYNIVLLVSERLIYNSELGITELFCLKKPECEGLAQRISNFLLPTSIVLW